MQKSRDCTKNSAGWMVVSFFFMNQVFKLQDLEKNIDLLQKLHKRDIGNEVSKHKETQRHLVELESLLDRAKREQWVSRYLPCVFRFFAIFFSVFFVWIKLIS